ncbi:MAG: FG-GAP repeat domain-containing protein, partial [Candidatus Kapaibacterium sp.]
MKKFLILIMLVCGFNAMTQENAASLPELQEWYSWKGSIFNTGGRVSYLPGFDSVGGGMNAITQHRNGKDIVWYNRFPFDTANQFQWKSKGAYGVYQIDFNNDGLPEYVDDNGFVYTTTKKGNKPNPEPVDTLFNKGLYSPLIGDMNNDGFTDVIDPN